MAKESKKEAKQKNTEGGNNEVSSVIQKTADEAPVSTAAEEVTAAQPEEKKKKMTKRQKQVQAAQDFVAATQEQVGNILNALDHMKADAGGLGKAYRKVARTYKDNTKVIRAKAGEETPEQPTKKELKKAAKAFKKHAIKQISKAIGDFEASKKLLKKSLKDDKAMQKAYKKMLKLAK